MTAQQISLFEPALGVSNLNARDPVLRIIRAQLRSRDPVVRFSNKAA